MAFDSSKSGTIATARLSQRISNASATRTYWGVKAAGTGMRLGIGRAADFTSRSFELPVGELVDSSTIGDITQAEINIIGEVKGMEFTYFEVEA